MKKNRKILLFCMILFVLMSGAFVIFDKTEAPSPVIVTSLNKKEFSNQITIESPKIGQILSSGKVSVVGIARGNWYFEANMPIDVLDNNKNVISQGYATAQGEWMTTDFVPFTGTIDLVVPQGITNGFVMFKNDNASGNPSLDRYFYVPVRFE